MRTLAQDRHLETERQLKEVKKSIEALSDGLLGVTQVRSRGPSGRGSRCS